MKKILSVVAAALMAGSVLVACGGGGASTPESVAESYTKALFKSDFNTCKKFATGDALTEVTNYADASGEEQAVIKELFAPCARAKMVAGAAKMSADGNYATVFTKDAESKCVLKVKLGKVDGEWKVNDFSVNPISIPGEEQEDEMGNAESETEEIYVAAYLHYNLDGFAGVNLIGYEGDLWNIIGEVRVVISGVAKNLHVVIGEGNKTLLDKTISVNGKEELLIEVGCAKVNISATNKNIKYNQTLDFICGE
jgi:hypothetical protein